MITPEALAKSGTEHGHQSALFCWAAQSGIPELQWLFAIPNGGFRNTVTAAMLKAEGVKSGVADIMLPVPSIADPMKNYNGLFIEMKKPGVKIRNAAQLQFGAFVSGQGYKFVVAYGWTEARDAILKYLGRV